MKCLLSKTPRCLLVIAAVLFAARGAAAAVANFDDLSLAPESYWNGSDGTGGFTSGDNWFTNAYNSSWGSWDGFAYSNRTDTGSTGMTGQYTAYSGNGAGGGVSGSANYGIGYVGWGMPPQTYSGYLSCDYAQNVQGAYFTNNAYAYDSMINGDYFAKKFGGATGDDADWFLLTIEGLDATHASSGSTVDFYLADYRFADNACDYIVTDWTYVDLTSLGTVHGLEFTLTSSDVGSGWMNTPAYFAVDNLNVPEPSTLVIFAIGGLVAGAFSFLGRRRTPR